MRLILLGTFIKKGKTILNIIIQLYILNLLFIFLYKHFFLLNDRVDQIGSCS
jgi:hypothetical protein